MSAFHYKKFAFSLVCIFLVIILGFFCASLFDNDQYASETENRTLSQKPEFTLSSVMSGKYTSDFETYFSDQFPGRDTFLEINKIINQITSQFTVGDSSVVSFNKNNQDDFAGQSIDDIK